MSVNTVHIRASIQRPLRTPESRTHKQLNVILRNSFKLSVFDSRNLVLPLLLLLLPFLPELTEHVVRVVVVLQVEALRCRLAHPRIRMFPTFPSGCFQPFHHRFISLGVASQVVLKNIKSKRLKPGQGQGLKSSPFKLCVNCVQLAFAAPPRSPLDARNTPMLGWMRASASHLAVSRFGARL